MAWYWFVLIIIAYLLIGGFIAGIFSTKLDIVECPMGSVPVALLWPFFLVAIAVLGIIQLPLLLFGIKL